MALPTINDVRPVNPVLTNLSIGLKNDSFIADRIAPPVRVNQKSGTYFIYDKEYWFRRETGGERSAEAPYSRVGYGISTATYDTVERGWEKATGDPVVAASQTPESLPQTDVQFLTNLMQMETEMLVAETAFVASAWGTDNTLSGTSQWSDFNNPDPIAIADTAIRTIRRATGTKPNLGIIGAAAWEKLKEHPLITEKYKYTQTGIMTPALVAAAMGLDEIVVGDQVKNTANRNATFVGADVWTDSMTFLKTQPTPGLQVAAGAYNFHWDEAGAFPWAVQSYRDDRARSNVNRIFNHQSPAIVSAAHGYHVLDIVA